MGKGKNYEEALNEALKYFGGEKLPSEVFLQKYALKHVENGGKEIFDETNPDEMHRRMAREYARVEKSYGGNNSLSEEEIYNLFKDFKYIVPAGSVMSGLGNDDSIESLSNCYVLGKVKDSYGSIMRYREMMVQLEKRRGGCGVDISELRPKDSVVHNAAKTSTGAISFMDGFSNLSNEVAMNGRRGALMISIDCRHPDIMDFIEIKTDRTKVTGANISVQFRDDFMEAVENDADYYLRWPVDMEIEKGIETPYNELIWMDANKCVKRVKAKEIWDKFIHYSWESAEPGLMYKDRHINYSPDGVYDEYRGVTTNPCVVGDTMVAVADGRGYVSIKELAEEGKDVPVFCLDNNRKLTVSLMRHPRLTGEKQKIYTIELDNGHKIECTGNHKILLNDKGYVEAKDLEIGDSVFMMANKIGTWTDIRFKNDRTKKNDYMFLTTSMQQTPIAQHKLIYDYYNKGNESPEVIHHADFNGLNNKIDNLIGMTRDGHTRYHSDMIKGENNPIFKIKNDKEKFDEYSKKMSESTKGDKNGNAKHVTNEFIILKGIELVKNLKRMFSENEWVEYAKENNLPMSFDNEYRSNDLGISMKDFSIKCAKIAGIDYYDADVRLYKNYMKVREYDKTAYIDNGKIMIVRKCETCGKEFAVEYTKREQAFCSQKCSNEYLHSNSKIQERRINNVYSSYMDKMEKVKYEQMILYNELLKLNDKVLLKDFEKECRKRGMSCRFNTKYGFKNYDELKKSALCYNHKVIGITVNEELEDVYNGTVDNYHNFFIGKFEETSDFGKPEYLSINNLQCGEIFMDPLNSCRLMHLNLISFVEDGSFNFNKFKTVCRNIVRLGDDLVDLELEHVSAIIKHIEDTYTDDDSVELDTWKKIYLKGKTSRRIGCGITGLADAIALCGIKMDSDEGYRLQEEIFRTKFISEVEEEVLLAKERGCFGGWDYSKEFEDILNIETGMIELEGKNDFYKMMASIDTEISDDILNDYKKYGRRNVSWSTVAPAGTVSILTQTTSGIEPLFYPWSTRKKKCTSESDRVDFVNEVGQKFTIYYVAHKPFKDWVIKNFGDEYNEDTRFGEDSSEERVKIWKNWFEQSPWYGCTANEIEAIKHVEMQGIAQKYCSHSISKTINLPENCSEDDINFAIFEGWKHGLKGVTVYRDNCRANILSKDIKKDCKCHGSLRHDVPKRPKVLPCDVKRFRNGGDKWIACVGLIDGMPYEIFTGLSEKLNIPEYVENGEIIKTKVPKEVIDEETGKTIIENVSKYDLKYIDKNGNEQIVEGLGTTFNKMFYNYSKLISGLLRHGMPIQYVISAIKSMKFDTDTINSWKSGVIRALKKYMEDGEIKGEVCPECGSQLYRENGCVICRNCGYSKCG